MARKSNLIIPDLNADPRYREHGAKIAELMSNVSQLRDQCAALRADLAAERKRGDRQIAVEDSEGSGGLAVVSRAGVIADRLRDVEAQLRVAQDAIGRCESTRQELVRQILKDSGADATIRRVIRDELAAPLAEATERLFAIMRQRLEYKRALDDAGIPAYDFEWPKSLFDGKDTALAVEDEGGYYLRNYRKAIAQFGIKSPA